MRKRTVSELRQAAIDAGWEGDPLANELLAALTDAANATPSPAEFIPPPGGLPASPASIPRGRSKLWLAVASAIASAAIVSLVAFYLWASSAIKSRDVELERVKGEAAAQLVRSETEMARLRTENATQLSNAANQVQALITAAQAVSKNSADAADSNHAAVNLYMTKFQELLEEAKRLRAAPAGAAPGPEK